MRVMIKIKVYDYLTEEQNELINKDLTGYLTQDEKEKINGLYNKEFKIKTIAEIVNVPSFVVIQLLGKELGMDFLNSLKSEYITFTKPQSYYGDLYVVFTDFGRVNKSKWVYCKELKISLDTIPYPPFLIHHINYCNVKVLEGGQNYKVASQTNKFNDTIENMCLILDSEMHRKLHTNNIKGLDELEMFVKGYIEDRFQQLEKLNDTIKDQCGMEKIQVDYNNLKLYTEIVAKQFELQKRKLPLVLEYQERLQINL